MRAPKHARLLAGVSAIALSVTACGSDTGTGNTTGSTSAAKSGGTIVKVHSEPENPLLPGNTTETGGGEIIDAMFTGLMDYNADTAAAENAMAESVTPSADRKTYTVKLKTGWKFHDGTEVKAKNFVNAWNYAAFGPNAQSTSYFFEPIAGYAEVQSPDTDAEGNPMGTPKATAMFGLKVVDDTTFEVALSAPNSTFVQRLGYTAFSPLPDSFFGGPEAVKAFETKPVGNGPFKFDKRELGVTVDLVKFADYQGSDKANIDGVTFRAYTDLGAAYKDVQAGNADILDTVPPNALTGDKWKRDFGDRAIEKAQGSHQTITPPTYVPALKNQDLIRAFSMAIDRPLITKTIFNGGRTPADGWVPPAVDGYKAGQCGEYCTYNPTRAKELLTQAGGYTDTLTIAYNADGGHGAWVDAICNGLVKDLGIKCQGKPYPTFKPLRADVAAKKMDGLIRTAWQMDYPSIENFLTPQYVTGASSNDGAYSNPAFDAKVAEANAADPAAANALYQEAEAMLRDNMPAIPLWSYTTQAVYSERLENVNYTPFGEADLSALSVK